MVTKKTTGLLDERELRNRISDKDPLRVDPVSGTPICERVTKERTFRCRVKWLRPTIVTKSSELRCL